MFNSIERYTINNTNANWAIPMCLGSHEFNRKQVNNLIFTAINRSVQFQRATYYNFGFSCDVTDLVIKFITIKIKENHFEAGCTKSVNIGTRSQALWRNGKHNTPRNKLCGASSKYVTALGSKGCKCICIPIGLTPLRH